MGLCAPPIIAEPGEWDDWPVTWTNLTVGTGSTVTARFVQIGNTVILYLSYTRGSTGGPTGDVSFSLPVPCANPGGAVADVSIVDANVGQYVGQAGINTTTTARILVVAASGAYANPTVLSASIPFVWQAGDTMKLTMIYEAA